MRLKEPMKFQPHGAQEQLTSLSKWATAPFPLFRVGPMTDIRVKGKKITDLLMGNPDREPEVGKNDGGSPVMVNKYDFLVILSIALFLVCPLYAGQKYSHKEPKVQDEFVQVYHDIDYPSIIDGKATKFKVIGRLTAPNGVASTDAAAYGQLKIIQSTTTHAGAQATTTSSTYQAFSPLKVTITPTSASNDVLVVATLLINNETLGNAIRLTIKRDSTDLSGLISGGAGLALGDVVSYYVPCTLIFRDSPATTSATVYQVFFLSANNSNNVSVGRNDTPSTITATEIVR